MEYAGFWRRFLGTMVDVIILMSISLVFNRFIPVIGWIISLTFGFLYYPFFWSSKARATPGKYLMGTAVVDFHGQQITFRSAVIRYIASYVSAVFFGFGYFVAVFTERKQTFHDLVAGTFVIESEATLESGLLQAWIDQIKSVTK